MTKSKLEVQEYNKSYYEKNKDKFIEYNKQANIKNKEKNKIMKQKYAQSNREKIMLLCAKRSAKNNNLPFDIELSDIIIPTHCPYLGVELTNIVGNGRVWTNPSLDKIVPSKGYTKGNIEVISMMANVMKNSASREQLVAFSINVLSKLAPEKLKDEYETYTLVV